MRHVTLLFALLACAPLLAAQTVPSIPAASTQSRPLAPDGDDYKSPGTAMAIGILLPGAGQLYAGKTGKGLALAGAGLVSAALVPALVASSSSAGTATFASLGAYAVFLGYGIATAGNDAREHNALLRRTALNIHPIVAVGSSGHPAFGMNVSMPFRL